MVKAKLDKQQAGSNLPQTPKLKSKSSRVPTSKVAPGDSNESVSVVESYVPLLYKLYREKFVGELMQEHGYANKHSIPELDKIVVSTSCSNILNANNVLDHMLVAMYLMTGEVPLYTKAHKSISPFKLRAGDIVGCMSVIRRLNMYDFMFRLINVYLANVVGFTGIKFSSIGKNFLNIGIKDVHVVPEVSRKVGTVRFGLNITICVKNSHSPHDVYNLLRKFDLPIKINV